MLRLDHALKLLLRRALRGIEHLGGRADRLHPDLHFQPKPRRLLSNSPQILRIQTPDKSDLGEMHHLNLPRGAIVQILRRRPVLAAKTEEIDSELDLGLIRHGCERRCGGNSEKRAAIHYFSTVSAASLSDLQSARGIKISTRRGLTNRLGFTGSYPCASMYV